MSLTTIYHTTASFLFSTKFIRKYKTYHNYTNILRTNFKHDHTQQLSLSERKATLVKARIQTKREKEKFDGRFMKVMEQQTESLSPLGSLDDDDPKRCLSTTTDTSVKNATNDIVEPLETAPCEEEKALESVTIEINEEDPCPAQEPSITDKSIEEPPEKIQESTDKMQESPPMPTDTGETKEFPAPFYCPLTHKVLQQPVVAPDGRSYEREAVLATGDYPLESLYPNRSLQSIISESVATLSEGNFSFQASLLRVQKSLRQSLDRVTDPDNYRPLPDAYYCSITFGLMHHPVIDPEGNTFEKVAIEGWIQAHGQSPITRTVMTVAQLYPNRAIADLLDIEKNRDTEHMHPSVLEWKQEDPPVAVDIETAAHTSSDPARNTATLFPLTEEDRRQREQNRRRMMVFNLATMSILLVLAIIGVMYGFAFFACLVAAIFVICRRSTVDRYVQT